MALTKSTKVNYEKDLNGQRATFNYEYSDAAPTSISINQNVNFPAPAPGTTPSAAPGTNGYWNINVVAANRAEALSILKAAIDAAFLELENVITNYQNPEQPA